jgi:hypothetical protein
LESAIQVNPSKETLRPSLYPGVAYAGTPHVEKVRYVLLDASDSGLAHDLGVNYAPKLRDIGMNNASFNGGDDFVGSARERLFGFINGQTGADNPNAQGFVHLVKDGYASQDASAGDTKLANALRHGGDLLNVFGDFHAVLFHQGAPVLGEGALRTGQGVAALRAAAAAHLSPAGQLQVATALEVIDALEARLHVVRHQLLDAARHLAGAKVLAARLYGVGPVTALAITCWLGGAGRFSSSRQAVRFAGLDITVSSSDRKGPPGKLSRQGPPVLRWAVYEAGKTHARTSAPDHRYYAAVKDRKNPKRACLSEARKILRQAHHILAELGDDALAAA